MKRLAAWLSSWATTLHIMIFERSTWKLLRDDIDLDDFTEVFRPEEKDPESS